MTDASCNDHDDATAASTLLQRRQATTCGV